MSRFDIAIEEISKELIEFNFSLLRCPDIYMLKYVLDGHIANLQTFSKETNSTIGKWERE